MSDYTQMLLQISAIVTAMLTIIIGPFVAYLLSVVKKNESEIITLRGLVDKWQERFYGLHREYTLLQSKYEQLKHDFEVMKAGSNG